MNVLILKLGATGDVVRTTPLLHCFNQGPVDWITSAKNLELLAGAADHLHALTWEERERLSGKHYDLVINLEDDEGSSGFLRTISYDQLFGAYLTNVGALSYTDDARGWFDLSLISKHGREKADALKLRNRRTYQDLIFAGLGLKFEGQSYLFPRAKQTGLLGDVAISPTAGAVWPMKRWAFYDELISELEAEHLKVNVLPTRLTLREHLADVQGHTCLVSGDSLPMHLALGSGVQCTTIFTCTSPWEIYGYGLQRQLISPLLERFFYQRDFQAEATTAISCAQVMESVAAQLGLLAAERAER